MSTQEHVDLHEHDDGSVLEALAGLDLVDDIDESLLAGMWRQVRRRPRGQLTRHFNLREFYCKDGTRPKPGRWRTYRALCRQFLEPMRSKFGACTVNSGYRTPSWNSQVGGERGSFHVNDYHDVDDVAADVTFARGTPAQWHAEAVRLRRSKRGGRGGIGRYSTFVHVDTRDYPADWQG
jgi:hypothetical protein